MLEFFWILPGLSLRLCRRRILMAINTIKAIRTTIDTIAINSISNGLNVICHMFPVVERIGEED